MLPVPASAAVEVPIIILTSRDGTSSLTVKPSRVDFQTIYDRGTFQTFEEVIERERSFIAGLTDTLSNADEIEEGITRVGVVLSATSLVDLDTLRDVRLNFLQESVSIGGHRSELGFLDKQTWGDWEVNHWLRLIATQQAEGQHLLEMVLDYNTASDQVYELNSDSLVDFLGYLTDTCTQEMGTFYE